MTREEAINYFKRSFAIGEGDDEKYHNEVLEYTIKNLEQQGILFKNGLLKDCESCKALEQQPCENCISRQAAIEVAKQYWYKPDIAGALAELPPVQSKIKTGKWIYRNYNWYCSECGCTPKTLGYVGSAEFMKEHFKFCNHCGAKMAEPQESGDKKC